MANDEQLAILRCGVEAWNTWRAEHPYEKIDLSEARFYEAQLPSVDLHDALLSWADLQFANLKHANLRAVQLGSALLDHADLSRADLTDARLWGSRLDETRLTRATLARTQFNNSRIVASNFVGADLSKANFERCYLEDTIFNDAKLPGASFYEANLWMAHFKRADLRETNFRGASLHGAHLEGATLIAADLRRTVLVGTNLNQATIEDCCVYGIAAWDVKLDSATKQANLIITPFDPDQSTITVDDLEVAQFVYLLLNNEKIRDVINTLGRKAILILGRFTPEPRKQVLDALRDALRGKGYVPIVFDFERPTQRDFTETIKTLAGLCLFVIADVTNPRSTPLELQATVPDYMLPFVPILQKGEEAFAMLPDLLKYPWVLKPVRVYESAEQLAARLDTAIVGPAVKLHKELLQQRVQALPIQDISELPADQ